MICKECKHYKRSEIIGVKCCEFGLHESYCEKDKEDFAIEELEKIKTEFENKEGVFTSFHFIKAINEHISNLKGGDEDADI